MDLTSCKCSKSGISKICSLKKKAMAQSMAYSDSYRLSRQFQTGKIVADQENHGLVTLLISNDTVCRTASAKLGL